MKKISSYFFTFIFGTFLSSTGISQPLQLLENLQSEISELITSAKYSIVTVSSQSKSSYVIDKNGGVKSLVGYDREEKKDDLWVVGSRNNI